MQNVEDLLNEKSIRITPMRQLLLEYLLKEQKAEGLSSLERVFPKADRVTIFRTLKTFVEKGILHQIENGTAEVKYALCKEHCSTSEHQDQHPHFHCLQCGQIECLETVFIPDLPLPQGYQSQETNMVIKGTCPNCN